MERVLNTMLHFLREERLYLTYLYAQGVVCENYLKLRQFWSEKLEFEAGFSAIRPCPSKATQNEGFRKRTRTHPNSFACPVATIRTKA